MLEAVEDLARVHPYIKPEARFMPAQYRYYCDGYYMALCAVLRAQQATIDRRADVAARELAIARQAIGRYWRRALAPAVAQDESTTHARGGCRVLCYMRPRRRVAQDRVS